MKAEKLYKYFFYDYEEWCKKKYSNVQQYTNRAGGYMTVSASIGPIYTNSTSTCAPYTFLPPAGYVPVGSVTFSNKFTVLDYLKAEGYNYSLEDLQKISEQETHSDRQANVRDYIKSRLIETWKEEK